jgi:hypothetical protein
MQEGRPVGGRLPALHSHMIRLNAGIVTLVLATTVQGADLPLVASDLTTGLNSHLRLTNTAEQPVTAWSLAITTPVVDGQSRRFEETVDAYLSEITRDLTGSTDKLDRLLPGQAREISLQQVATGSSVEVIAVVLQDGTALGDVRTIQSIFERRQMERDDLRAVADIFSAVLPATTGIPAFEELKRRFANPPQRSESTPMRSARDAVDAYLKVITVDNADALTQQLRSYADLVQRQHELAVRHSQQKKP